MENSEIGVTGPYGRLGRVLVNQGCTALDVDITDWEALRQANLDRYAVIINCAAITDVDGCEHTQTQTETYRKAVEVNTRGVEYLRNAYTRTLIHLSSDYVFDGTSGPYNELSRQNPVNDYGWTKFGGEMVLESHPRRFPTWIVRTTGLYGVGNDFASYVISSLLRDEMVLATNNLHANQTYIPHLVKALLALCHRADVAECEISYLHLASVDLCTRYEFARRIALAFDLPMQKVCPISSSQISNWRARRPMWGGLKTDLARIMGLPLFGIQEGIQDYRRTE